MRTIQRHSPLTGKLNTMDLDVTVEQLVAWRRGELIQKAMPDLTMEEREFILTGCLPGEFERMFAEAE